MKHNYVHFIKFVYRASPVAASGHLYYFLSLLFFTFSIFPFRSSHRKFSIRKAVLIILNILRKIPPLESLFKKVHACNFIKKETLAQVFSCEFCKISKNIFFTEHLWVTASINIWVFFAFVEHRRPSKYSL